jgi:hypothetical protein
MTYKNLLTDPKKHESEDFLYVVHAINTYGEPIDLDMARASINTILDPNQFYQASLVGILNAEAAKSKFNWVSGPLRQTHVYGESYGLIVNPMAEENIHIAWHGDIDSPRNSQTLRLFAFENRGKIKDPLTLLTRSILRNEMVIRGDDNISQIQGLFVLDESNISREDKVSQEAKRENAAEFARLLRDEYHIEVPTVEEPAYYDTTRARNYFDEVYGIFEWPKGPR